MSADDHEYCPECGVCQNDHGNPLRHMHLTTCSRSGEYFVTVEEEEDLGDDV